MAQRLFYLFCGDFIWGLLLVCELNLQLVLLSGQVFGELLWRFTRPVENRHGSQDSVGYAGRRLSELDIKMLEKVELRWNGANEKLSSRLAEFMSKMLKLHRDFGSKGHCKPILSSIESIMYCHFSQIKHKKASFGAPMSWYLNHASIALKIGVHLPFNPKLWAFLTKNSADLLMLRTGQITLLKHLKIDWPYRVVRASGR